jgi:hypothetical protein
MSNQVQIPVLQDPNGQTVQLQLNVNKVFRNLNNQLNSVQTSLDEMTVIGEIKTANLSLAQFQAVTGINWVLCDGSSCVATAYSKLTGNNTVPTITSPFGISTINAFIRIS